MLVTMLFNGLSPLLLISYAVQALLVIHCFKTGRNTMWIWVLVFLPAVGALAYVVVEVLPDLFGSRRARRATSSMRRALDPGQDLRRFEAEARRTGDVASNQRYADELVRQGRNTEALGIYRQALRGLYEHDPNLLLGLARAQFAGGDASGARATLDTLQATNPNFKSPEGHLLYARALEGEGNHTRALDEFGELSKYYAGAEAALRYAQLQARTGDKTAARSTLENLLEHARHAPRHYQRAQDEWLSSARRELAAL